MESLSTDKVAEVIILAREMAQGVAGAEGEFNGFVGRLSEDEQAELVALMWLGRGTYEPEDFAEAVATATQAASTPTEDYLKGSPHLADHLENGLDALGISAADAEDDLYRK